MIVHLTELNFVTMPWANGKGTTVEMLRIDREGQMILRLSRAKVVEDGAFSLFPGAERNLTVLCGPGFDLVGEGVHLVVLPLAPVAFAGDLALRTVGVSAPSEDFNVMTGRNLPRAKVWVRPPGQAPAGAVLALKAGRIGGLNVARYDLILTDQPLQHDVSVILVQAEGLLQ